MQSRHFCSHSFASSPIRLLFATFSLLSNAGSESTTPGGRKQIFPDARFRSRQSGVERSIYLRRSQGTKLLPDELEPLSFQSAPPRSCSIFKARPQKLSATALLIKRDCSRRFDWLGAAWCAVTVVVEKYQYLPLDRNVGLPPSVLRN